MSNNPQEANLNQLPFIRRKMIECLIITHSELRFLCYAKVYTSNRANPRWLYSELEGGLALTINQIGKCGKLTLYDSTTYEILFEFELYKRFNGNFQRITDNFYCFEIEGGFVGFYIPDKEDGLLLAHEVSELSDSFILKKVKEYRPITEQSLRATGEGLFAQVKNKVSKECYIKEQPRIPILELNIKSIEKDFDTLDIDEANQIVYLGGNGNDVEMLFKKIKGVKIQERNKVKIGNRHLYSKSIASNVYNISKGELGYNIDLFRERMKNNQFGPKLIRVNAFQTDLSGMVSNEKKESEVNTHSKSHEEVKSTKKEAQYVDVPVARMEKVNKAGKGGIPALPSLPPMNLNIPVIPKGEPVKASPIDLQAELDAKKNKLAKAEIHEPVSSALMKEGEQSTSSHQEVRGGNAMQNELMQRMMNRRNVNVDNLEKKKLIDSNTNSTIQSNSINQPIKSEMNKEFQSTKQPIKSHANKISQQPQPQPQNVNAPKVEIKTDKKGIPVPPPMDFPQVVPQRVPAGTLNKRKPSRPINSKLTMSEEISKGVKLKKVTTQEKFGLDYQKDKTQLNCTESTPSVNPNTNVDIGSNEYELNINNPSEINIMPASSGGQANMFSMIQNVHLKKVEAKIEVSKPKEDPEISSSSTLSSIQQRLKALNKNAAKQNKDKISKPIEMKKEEIKPVQKTVIPTNTVMSTMVPKQEEMQEAHPNPVFSHSTRPMMMMMPIQQKNDLLPKPQETIPEVKLQPPVSVPKVEIKTNKKGIPLPPPMDFPKHVAQPKTAPVTKQKPAAHPKSSGLTMAEEISKGVKLKKVTTEEKFGINYQKEHQEENSSGGDNNNTTGSGSGGQNPFMAMLKGVQLKKVPKNN